MSAATSFLNDQGAASAGVLFDDMHRLTRSIHSWNVASESVYLAVGEAIQNLHRKVSEVRDGIRRSTEIFAGEEIGEMRQGLAAAAEDSQRTAALSVERCETLARLRASVEIAASGSSAVLLVFRLLDYVVLIARAQVEGISEGQDELGPFTAHVDELVSVGEGVARGIDERTQLLGRCLSESRVIETQAGIDGTSLIDDFLALAARVEAQQRASAERRDEAHAAFTSIWKAIGGIVAGLQFHDMARQRLEHTLENLACIPDLGRIGVIAADVAPLVEGLRPAALRRIATLEIAQLDDLACLYEAKMGELDGHLVAIGGEIDRSEVILGQLLRSGGGEVRGASLDTEAARLKGHFQRGEDARRRLGRSLDQCVEATQSLLDMTGKLDDLEHDLKIAGLNAAVRAAHVKSGDDTIGYIARVICQQASIARSEADRVRQGIELAVTDTQDLSQRILPAISGAESAIEGRLNGTTTVLGAAQAALSRELDAAMAVARSLPAAVAAAREMMTPHVEGCKLMRSLAASLAALAANLPETVVRDDAMAEVDEILSCRYTMVEERAIFAAVVGRNVPASLPAADTVPLVPAPGSDEDLDDIFF